MVRYLDIIVEALQKITFNGDRIKVDAQLEVGDIEIGAVEIKNHDSDLRVFVKAIETTTILGPATENAIMFQEIRNSLFNTFSQMLVPADTEQLSESAIDLRNLKSAALSIRVAFHAAATKGVEVSIITSPNAVLWDTEPYIENLEPPFEAGGTKQLTVPIDVSARYIKLKVINLDTGQSVTVDGFVLMTW